jgi:pimeloyl-ACP methyl ester carboxylesterase
MSQQPPVLLVHGLFAPRATMLPFQWALKRAGLEAYTVRLPILNMAAVEGSSRLVAARVDEILDRSGHERLDIVGMSLGGLIGLHYLMELGGAARVRRMITLGTPVAGTWSALAALGSPAARQCLPGSDFLERLDAKGLPETVEVIAVYGSFDPVAPKARCIIPGVRNIEIKTLPQPLAHQSLIASPAAVKTLIGLLEEP